MSKTWKLAASALLITGLGTGLDATSAEAAMPTISATAGCGSACDGKNPATYTIDYNGSSITCSLDAVTKKSARSTDDEPVVNLRYSPRCRTAWAQLPAGTDYWIYVYSYNSSGSLRRTEKSFVEGGPNYTLMVNDAGYTAKACIADSPGAASPTTCTAKY
jgi:hypothetical protein